MTDSIELRHNPEAHRYEAWLEDRRVGFAAYRPGDGVVSFVHTEVDDACAGMGIGGRLARFALDDVRSTGAAVQPLCPFIRAWIEKHPDYQDLVRRESGDE